MIVYLAVIILLISFVAPCSVFSQTTMDGMPAALGEQKTVADPEYQTRMVLARKLISARNYQGASAILEVIFEERPLDRSVQNLLLTCYTQMQQFDRAEILIRRQVENNPKNYIYILKLAEVLSNQGNLEESMALYDRTIDLVGTKNTNRYLSVIRSLISHGMEPRAMELIDSVRVLKAEPGLYAQQRGAILELQKEYALASGEYIAVLRQDTTSRVTNAERKLTALLRFEESSAVVEQSLLSAVELANSAPVLKLLASHYLFTKRFDDAFGFALRQDSLEQNNGQALLRYIRQCENHKAWSQVVLMSEYVLSRYPDGPRVPEVMFKYSEGLVEIDQPLEAIAVLNGMVASFPNNQKAADAYSRIGSIYYDDLNDPVKALASFESTLKQPTRGTEYLIARKGIPYCYLRLGRLDDASEGFEGLRRLKLNKDITEEIDYNLALIKLYEKQYDSSEVALRRLMVVHPRGFYVNDALQLLLLIGEVKESKELLYDYSNALYFEQRLMYDSARVRLEQLSEGESRTAADIALFRLSELEFRYHDTTAALAAIDRLIADFPDSYYRPHGIKARADVLVLDIETREEAVELYTQLLQDYPNYPFISEVRKRLRGFKISHKIG